MAPTGSPASLWLVGAVRRKLAALFKEREKEREPLGGALCLGGGSLGWWAGPKRGAEAPQTDAGM